MTHRLHHLSTIVPTFFASASFLCFGLGYLLMPKLKAEFVRYRLERFRLMVGWLQIAGAAGLMLGLQYSWLGMFAASGLALMMAVAVATRLRIGDSFIQCVPALLYLLLNAYICIMLLVGR